jgi:hypothetical protein
MTNLPKTPGELRPRAPGEPRIVVGTRAKRFYRALVLLAVGAVFLSPRTGHAQAWHWKAPITSGRQPLSVDLTKATNVQDARLTIQNTSTASTVTFPWVSTADTQPLLTPQQLAAFLSQSGTVQNETFAIASWQYVLSHFVHYCDAGAPGDYPGTPYATSTAYRTSDAYRLFYGHGMGCCDQVSRALAAIWLAAGYSARIAEFSFHTIPEIYYGGAWHMLDPDHRVYYRNGQGQIASVADVLANPSIVLAAANASGQDPSGFSASTMESLYEGSASTLTYANDIPALPSAPPFVLRPHESVQLHDRSHLPGAFYLDTSRQGYEGSPYASATIRRPIVFADESWTPSFSSNVGIVVEPSGRTALASTGGYDSGLATYSDVLPFPIQQLLVSGEIATSDPNAVVTIGFSIDGATWQAPLPVTLQRTGQSEFFTIDLTPYARGQYSYNAQLQINGSSPGAIVVYGLEVRAEVQMAAAAFPRLTAAAVNNLVYMDASPATDTRSLTVELELPSNSPSDNPEIDGLSAESLIPESPASLALNQQASKLVDGDTSTLGSPGTNQVDYAVHLHRQYRVTGVTIHWGPYGPQAAPITTWSLQGRNGLEAWQVLHSGGSLGASVSDVWVEALVTDLRVVASGPSPIGVYEVVPYGEDVAPVRPSTVTSNVPQDPTYSLAAGYAAANLIDGNSTTLAYPASEKIDYQIAVSSTPVRVSSATIRWGTFGSSIGYVDNWSLLALDAAGNWVTVASGDSPGVDTSTVFFDTVSTQMRLVASSNENWIGAYEISFTQAPLRPYGEVVVPIPPTAATSNVPEDPIYSLARGHGAVSLIDGNPATLAYPASKKIDYQLALSSTPVNLKSATIRWGTYGSSTGYVDSWSLLALDSTGSWTTVASGGFPGADSSTIPLDITSTQLRLVASSNENWIGAYEVSFTQQTLAPSVTSNVPESAQYSVVRHYPASNLADGNTQTLAYPAAPNLDYIITYPARVHATAATVVWGNYGSAAGYVDAWSLLAQDDTGAWVTLASGGFPGATATTVNFDTMTTKLRLVASSTTNWIGAYEVRFTLSNPTATIVQPSQVFSNVADTNPYAFPASNLVDGNTKTFAYAASLGLDYQLDFAADTALETLTITWNEFGAQPNNIDTWTVYGQRTGDMQWLPVASGGFPNASRTTIRLGRTFRQLRITAASNENWIGIYEATITGVP